MMEDKKVKVKAVLLIEDVFPHEKIRSVKEARVKVKLLSLEDDRILLDEPLRFELRELVDKRTIREALSIRFNNIKIKKVEVKARNDVKKKFLEELKELKKKMKEEKERLKKMLRR